MSDSASLIRKYHDFDLHKRLSPAQHEYKKIFDELENMRCEVLGSLNMPGIKKNISDFLESEITNEIKNNAKISKEKTINFILRDFLLEEKLSDKYKKNLDKGYKKFQNFFQNYKKDIFSLINDKKSLVFLLMNY